MLKFVKSRLKAFDYAWSGLVDLFANHEPAWVHLMAIAFAVSASWWLDFPAWKWAAIIGCIGFTLTTEALNTGIEYVVDLVSPDYHELAGKAKDVAAAAVLIASITAVLVFVVLVYDQIR